MADAGHRGHGPRRGGYRVDPLRERVAVELLRGLTGEAIDEVGNWAELLDARRESLAAAAPAIPEAAELVAALRRLAAERDG